MLTTHLTYQPRAHFAQAVSYLVENSPLYFETVLRVKTRAKEMQLSFEKKASLARAGVDGATHTHSNAADVMQGTRPHSGSGALNVSVQPQDVLLDVDIDDEKIGDHLNRHTPVPQADPNDDVDVSLPSALSVRCAGDGHVVVPGGEEDAMGGGEAARVVGDLKHVSWLQLNEGRQALHVACRKAFPPFFAPTLLPKMRLACRSCAAVCCKCRPGLVAPPADELVKGNPMTCDCVKLEA